MRNIPTKKELDEVFKEVTESYKEFQKNIMLYGFEHAYILLREKYPNITLDN